MTTFYLPFIAATLLTFLLTTHITPTAAKPSIGRAAAMCLRDEEGCRIWLTLIAKHCKPHIAAKEQPTKCISTGCVYCSHHQKKEPDVCTGTTIPKACPYIAGTPTASATPSPSPTHSATPTPTVSPSTTSSPSPSRTATTTPSPSPTQTMSPSPTPTATSTPSPSITPTATPSPSRSPSPSPTASPSATPSATPSPIVLPATTQPTPGPHFPFNCVFHAVGKQVVIHLDTVYPFSHWSTTEHKRSGMKGLTWRANRTRKESDIPGTGEMCFDFKVGINGTYYFTAITSAPHKSDHNDMWVRTTSGFRLFHAGTHRQKRISEDARSHFKGYQNAGFHNRSKLISTVNGDPHIFVTDFMVKTESYEVCISGRSSQFSVYSLVFMKCRGISCRRTSTHIRRAMDDSKLVAPDCVRKAQ